MQTVFEHGTRKLPTRWSRYISLWLTLLLVSLFLLYTLQQTTWNYFRGALAPSPCGRDVGRHPVQSPRLMYANLIGGLGNQLWAYTTMYALAKRTGRTPIMCSGLPWNEMFTNLTYKIRPKGVCSRRSPNLVGAQTAWERNSVHYDMRILSILSSSTKVVFVCCYLQNRGYSYDYLDDFKTEFLIHPKYVEAAQKLLREMVSNLSMRPGNTTRRNRPNPDVFSGGSLNRKDPPDPPDPLSTSGYMCDGVRCMQGLTFGLATRLILQEQWGTSGRSIKGAPFLSSSQQI